MLHSPTEQIDLRGKSAYLDLFYFREMNQQYLQKQLLPLTEGVAFVADQLNLTQHILEKVIKPKVIFVKNRESSGYWGKLREQNIIWLGYDFEKLGSHPCGELYKIKGLIDSNQRISPEIMETNLRNTLLLFSQHITRFMQKDKKPTAQFIEQLLNDYHSKQH